MRLSEGARVSGLNVSQQSLNQQQKRQNMRLRAVLGRDRGLAGGALLVGVLLLFVVVAAITVPRGAAELLGDASDGSGVSARGAEGGELAGRVGNVGRAGAPPPPETVKAIAKLLPETVLKASLVGALQQMEHEAIALLKQVTRVLNAELPDCERVLAEMTALRDRARPAAETAGKILREQRAILRKNKTLKQYQDRMAAYFAVEIGEYERAVARFELLATNEQLLRFNALIKGLTAPLSD